MSNPEKQKWILRTLLEKSIEGLITVEETKQFNDLLAANPELESYYIKCVQLHIALGQFQMSGSHTLTEESLIIPEVFIDSNASLRGVDLSGLNLDTNIEESEGSGLYQEILALEWTSPAVEIEKPAPEEPKRELIQKVERDFKWFPGRPSKFQIRLLAAIAACILVTVGYLHFFVPNYIDRPIVAEFRDSVDAVWDGKFQTPDEYGDMVQSRYKLNQGFATILFKDGAKVTIESPTELSINSSGDMELFSGRIYAVVPDRAHGFTVKAGGSKIVDLGTEFGIEVDQRGDIQLHVTKGRTMLFAGLLRGKKQQISVDEGSARKIYGDGCVIDIPLAKTKFARRVNSESNLIIRNDELNLADVVGGGNGFGTGKEDFGISLADGRYVSTIRGKLRGIYSTPFLKVGVNPFIDSVFIPDGGRDKVTISSTGMEFSGFVNTSGINCYNIYNQGPILYYGKDYKYEAKFCPTMMGGTRYGHKTNSAIFMHSNAGITFDLAAIQKMYGNFEITGFKTRCGIPEGLEEGELGYADLDFWILVDGQEKFKRLNMKSDDNTEEVAISLTGSERFLTLAVTDGGGDYRMDLALFGDPVLLLEFDDE